MLARMKPMCISQCMDISLGVMCEVASRVISFVVCSSVALGAAAASVSYVVLWKQEKRLCFFG